MTGLSLFQRTRDPASAPCAAHGLTGVATSLMAAALVCQSLGPSAQLWLRYDRHAVAAGQIWRVLTGHLVHLGWAHLLLNGVGLALLAALLGKQQRASDWWLAVAASAVAVAGGLLACDPDVDWYVGLSGVLHGVFAAGCVALLRRSPFVAMLALAALLGKLAWEQGHPPSAAREALVGGRIIVQAHLYGAAGGLLAAAWVHARPMWRALQRHRRHRHPD